MSDHRTLVYCQTTFEGFHRWPDAPDSVGFLKLRHRHIFHVKVMVRVQHEDRDVEFITLKHHTDEAIRMLGHEDVLTWSCEHWALGIQRYLKDVFGYWVEAVDVSEDGENGAVVVW